jgi:acyl dehydratase
VITEDRIIRVLPADTPGLVRAVEHVIDDRWLRAYAASVGDTRPEFFDLEHSGGIIGHPVFPVCIEWPLVEHGAPGIELTVNTLRLGLHVSHQMRLHAPLRPAQRVRTEAELYLAEARTDATLIATRFRTSSSTGELLVTTILHMLYRGVRLEGSKTPDYPHEVTPRSGTDLAPLAKFKVDATNAVIYTECARIWNPIHTDIRVAHAAGLPDTVLHGTETLARAVSTISRAGALPAGAVITGIGCRFTGPVFPGATLTVSAADLSEDSVAFDVQDSDGTSSISDGSITFELPS